MPSLRARENIALTPLGPSTRFDARARGSRAVKCVLHVFLMPTVVLLRGTRAEPAQNPRLMKHAKDDATGASLCQIASRGVLLDPPLGRSKHLELVIDVHVALFRQSRNVEHARERRAAKRIDEFLHSDIHPLA